MAEILLSEAATGGVSGCVADPAGSERQAPPSGHGLLPPYDGSRPLPARVKRFFERWLADEAFRAALVADPAAAVRQWGLEVDPEALHYLWDDACRPALAALPIPDLIAGATPATVALFSWMEANSLYRQRLRDESWPVQPEFAAWRARQMGRARTSFRAAYDLNTPHITFAIELSRGCSVGCWFCGVDAPKLGDIFRHDPANQALLRETLRLLAARTGLAAARHGFLYWATDPFDNPDYEAFCLDFLAVCGEFPLTTTALALRDLDRTRAFIRFAAGHGAEKVRFSVSTLRQLDQLHAAFTPEELGIVDLITLNKGSLLQPSPSGRARGRLQRQAARNGVDAFVDQARDQTISCVSGFLLNMVDRSVKLISPCNSSERWPLGYFVYEEARFGTAAELASLLDGMIARHMPATLSPEAAVAFRPDLRYEPEPDGFRLLGEHGSHDYRANLLLRDLGDLVAAGTLRRDEILQPFDAFCATEAAREWLDRLFADGVLDEEPRQ